jgi:hypothetical protein
MAHRLVLAQLVPFTNNAIPDIAPRVCKLWARHHWRRFSSVDLAHPITIFFGADSAHAIVADEIEVG